MAIMIKRKDETEESIRLLGFVKQPFGIWDFLAPNKGHVVQTGDLIRRLPVDESEIDMDKDIRYEFGWREADEETIGTPIGGEWYVHHETIRPEAGYSVVLPLYEVVDD